MKPQVLVVLALSSINEFMLAWFSAYTKSVRGDKFPINSIYISVILVSMI